MWWLSGFGPIEVQAPYLRCPKDNNSHRPFQELTGLKGRCKSLALQRALTDFGAEKSFERAIEQLKEHYGVELDRSSVREVVRKQAERAAGFVDREDRAAIDGYGNQRSFPPGKPWLIVESDGAMVRTGELAPDPGGRGESGETPPQAEQADSVAGSAAQCSGDAWGWGAAICGGVGFSPKGRGADVCSGAAVRL